MASQCFEVQESPVLSLVHCRGDVVMQGWSRPMIRIQSDVEQLHTQQEGQTVMVEGQSDLRIDAPYDTQLQAGEVNGDVVIKRIEGSIALANVRGDLVLSGVGAVSIEHVRGDLSARVVEGKLLVQEVLGDMSVRGLNGRLQIDHAGRDLGLRDLAGDAQAPDVLGDIRLRTAVVPGSQISLKAGGSIVARVPADTSADLTLRCGRGQPMVKARLTQTASSHQEVTGRLGDGGSTIMLEAGRELVFAAREAGSESDWDEVGQEIAALGSDLGMEFAGLAEEIAAQIDRQMGRMSARLEEKLSGVGHLNEQAARATERAHRQAEKAAERIRRTAERQAELARRRAGRTYGRTDRVSRTVGGGPTVPEKTSEPVTNEERMVILNMVAEGRISVDEAEALLEALNVR
jgi:hypothetical protein